jgi:hypothetical protein
MPRGDLESGLHTSPGPAYPGRMSGSRTDEFDDDDVDLEEEFPEDVEDYEPDPNVLDEDDLEIDDDYDATDEDEVFPDDERPVRFDPDDDYDDEDDDDEFDPLDDE